MVKSSCPFCEFKSSNVGSIIMHIRSSADEEHGSRGNMPNGYIKEQIVEMVEHDKKVYTETHSKGTEEEVETSNINNQTHDQEVSHDGHEVTQESGSGVNEGGYKSQQQVSEAKNYEDEQSAEINKDEASELADDLNKLKEAPDIEERINEIATEVSNIRSTNDYHADEISEIQEQLKELTEEVEELNKRLDIHKQVLEELLRKLGAKDKTTSTATTESGKGEQKEEEEEEA